MRTLLTFGAVTLAAAGCSEYGLFGHPSKGDLGSDEAGAGDPGGDGADPADPGGDGGGSDTLVPFPGEELPPEWPAWDDACSGAGLLGGGGGGGAGTDQYTITDPVDTLHVLLTVGNLDIVPRAGPIEVVLHGVRLNGAQGPTVSGGVLTLDYTASVGDLTVYAPTDLLAYDARVCVGDLTVSELAGDLTVEVRTGALFGAALASPEVAAHNRTGSSELDFDVAPDALWMEGATGDFVADVPADRCDCDLAVTGAGLAQLQGIDDDPNAPMAVWARRNTGMIRVRAR